ncbi:hypothetical protein GHK86_03810 [Acidimicrobiaceae bacterium USS-CC1]|uniref:Uncharacterized protein n=1 Tax=Acidiferrimicrobium australe TaxID=2664430 RepID=A0ABW9QTZ5_9ACTN|nr:hypothetical protein [Acidiferrimicrobium australe]
MTGTRPAGDVEPPPRDEDAPREPVGDPTRALWRRSETKPDGRRLTRYEQAGGGPERP